VKKFKEKKETLQAKCRHMLQLGPENVNEKFVWVFIQGPITSLSSRSSKIISNVASLEGDR
jgi:hypothetical protein